MSTTTFQWLIERELPEGNYGSPIYLENSAQHPATHCEWTSDPWKAAMFPDRQAAEAYIVDWDLEAHAVEHGFTVWGPERMRHAAAPSPADEEEA